MSYFLGIKGAREPFRSSLLSRARHTLDTLSSVSLAQRRNTAATTPTAHTVDEILDTNDGSLLRRASPSRARRLRRPRRHRACCRHHRGSPPHHRHRGARLSRRLQGGVATTWGGCKVETRLTHELERPSSFKQLNPVSLTPLRHPRTAQPMGGKKKSS